MWLASQASDREVTIFTPILGVYTVASSRKVICANFPSSVVTVMSSYELKSNTENQAQKAVLGNAFVALWLASDVVLRVRMINSLKQTNKKQNHCYYSGVTFIAISQLQSCNLNDA